MYSIYADIVMNQMTGTERSGVGTAGSKFDGGTLDFPEVPYTSTHFNPRSKCPSGSGSIQNYGNAMEVRNCNLLTLADLDQVRHNVAVFSKIFLFLLFVK